MSIATKERPTAAAPSTGLVRVKSRGYYRDAITGEKLKSVTTILSQGVPKEALVYWAGNLTAETALDNLPYLVRASMGSAADRAEAYDWLRRSPTRKKEDRADIGGAVHDLIEAEILGTPLPEALLDDPEMAPYIIQFRRFVADWQVVFEASEMVVANYTHGYAGTLDHLLRSPFINDGALTMGDTKTGGELDVKGVYSEAGLQESAYRRAEFGWLRDGSRVPMPQTAGGVVLHLRPEGYRVVPVRCDDVVFDAFLHAMRVAEFTSTLSRSVVGKPMHPGDGHVLRPDGSCRYCSHTAPAVVSTPHAADEPPPCDGSCEDPDACIDCSSTTTQGGS